jgi:uncharacterized protein (UPF0332 family)
VSLEDRVLSGELERMRPSTGEVSRLLEAARRRADAAANATNHPEIRLEQAYEAILNCALAALLASGLRPTNRPGKHVTVIASLRETLGVPAERVDYYQMLRTLRHRTLYEGTLDVAPSQAEQSASEARALLAQTERVDEGPRGVAPRR